MLFPPAENAGMSENLNELKNVVKISVPAQRVKWEIFETPEYKGSGAPGPTDYMTLIAEIELIDLNWFNQFTENTDEVWIAPESARPWLSIYFRAMLEKRGTTLGRQFKCKKFRVEVTKSGRPVEGFVCENNGLVLIHVKLYDSTPKEENNSTATPLP